MTNGISRIRTAGVSALVALTATAGLVPLASSADAAANLTVTRFAGTDRFDTAKLISAAFGSAGTVVIARGDTFPDALAGSYVAGQNAAPILLTRTDSVPQTTLDALTQTGATRAVILGGTTAISSGVESTLRNRGLTVTRIGGATRYDTAQMVAEQPGAAAVGSLDSQKTAIVVSGANFPDALSGGPVAYAAKFPVILTPPTSLGAQAKSAIANLGIKNVLILGGPAAVSQAVEDALKAAAPQGSAVSVSRIQGANRAATAVAVAQFSRQKLGFSDQRVGVARGDDFADALTYGPLAGKSRAQVAQQDTSSAPNNVLLTTSFNVAGPEVLAELTSLQPTVTQLELNGGFAALDQNVETQLTNAAKGTGGTGGNNVTMNSNTVPSGGSLGGSVSGTDITSMSVSGCGFTNTAVTTTGTGTFTLSPFQNSAGSCTLTFTINRSGGQAPLTQTIPITVTGAGQPVTLTNTTGNVGGAVNGTVTSPASVNSLLVSGCNLTSQTIAVNATTGGFTFNLPTSQPAGTCNLTFTINRTNGTVETAGPFAFTVTGTQGTSGNGPNLVSATADATNNTVTYVFDKAPSGAAPVPANFKVWSGGGAPTVGLAAPAPVVSGNSVTVQFPANTVATATLASVLGVTTLAPIIAAPAVASAGGQGNPTSATAVASGAAPNTTIGNDLRSIQNCRTENPAGNTVCDFTFDQAVASVGGQNTAPAPGALNGFEVILSDNSAFAGAAIGTGVTAPGAGFIVSSADLKTVTVNFGTGVPVSQIVRGAVAANSVTTAAAPATANPDGSAPFASGGATINADLVSAQIVSSTQLNATFDQAVAAGAPVGAFTVFNANAVGAAPTVATRSSVDDKVYQLTFAAGVLGGAVQLSVQCPTAPGVGCPGNVNTTGGVGTFTGSEDATVAIASVQPGRTALSDLVSVSIVKDGLGRPIVTYTFDAALPAAYAAPANDFLLYDANGQASQPAGGPGKISDDRTQVIFGGAATTPASGAYTIAQATSAVVGSVRDSAAAGNFPDSGFTATKTGF